MRVFPLIALFGISFAQSNLTAILESIPTCAAGCSSKVLTPANCSLAEIRDCFCTSFTIQYEVGVCVLESCNLTEQYISTVITQGELCVGIPQPTRSRETIIASIIIAAIAFPIVILRFISRVIIAHKVWWDDWAILVAAICMLPNTTIPIYLSYHGLGKHFYDVLPQDVRILGQLFYVSQIFYVLIQNISKFSILLLYLRIFPSPRFVFMVKSAMAWMVCHTIAFVFAVVFQCDPVAHFWDATISGKCVNVRTLLYVGAGFSIAEDLMIMLLPIYELKGLNLTLSKRVALGGMFALGSFACITSMIRLKYVVLYGTSIDTTWNNVDTIVWSEIETYTAVICSCLMCIRPLFYRFLPSVFSSTQSGTASRSAMGTGNPNWGQKISSKMRQSRTGHEILGEEDGGNRRDRPRKAGKIIVTTESSVSYELNHRDLQRSLGHDRHFLEDASEESTENLHARYDREGELA